MTPDKAGRFMIGHGDVRLARIAFNAWVGNFLEAPFYDHKLMDEIKEAYSQRERSTSL